MDTNTKIKKVYSLFSEGNFKEAQELNNQILETYPNQMYAIRYKSMLDKKLSHGINEDINIAVGGKPGTSEKIAKLKGKSLKCPHCLAKIPFSGLNLEQQKAIKSGDYNNLEIKCPYCHTQFVLQKRKLPSMLGLKIGDTAFIEGKKYRTTGYVQYKGKWYEGKYSGKTYYLEWLLLGEDNSYYYFSEGKSYDEGDVEYEFELSKKIIPHFSIPSRFKESVKVSVVSVYGENSKKYSVGEKVELGEFSSGGKKYVVEKEGSGSQMEAGVYELTSLSKEKAFKLFNKAITKDVDFGYGKQLGINKTLGDNMGSILIYGFFGVIILFNLMSEGVIGFSFFLYIIGGIFSIFILKILFDIVGDKKARNTPIFQVILIIIAFPVLTFLIFKPIFNIILDDKQQIRLNELQQGKKIILEYTDSDLMKTKTVSSTSYSRGGTKTYYEKNKGIRFSISSEEDKLILKNIKAIAKQQTIINDDGEGGLNSNEEGINKIFSKSNLYKIR